MSSDEEYLDDLLKSIMGSEDESEHLSAAESMDGIQDEGQEEIEEAAPIDLDMLANNLENSDFFGDDFAIEDLGVVEPEPGELEGLEGEDALGMDISEEDMSSDEAFSDDLAIDDFAIEDFEVVEPSPEDLMDEEEFSGEEEDADGEAAEGIDDIDSFLNDFAIEEPDVDEMPEENLISPDEVDAMFAAADEAASGSDNEDSIPDISDDDILDLGLMETPDESTGEFSGDDMLAMLERMAEETEESSQALSGDVIEEEKKEKGKHKKSRKEKKEKGSGLFGKKKKSEDANVVAEGTLEGSVADDAAGEADEQEKKPGFFNKVMAFLTETDDEEQSETEPGMEPSDENKNILKELDKEDKKKKKKKVKGKKGAQEPKLDENGEPIEAEPDKKKEKKEKKKKKKEKTVSEAEFKERFTEKPGKKVSKKNIGIIAGLCLTFTAVIVVFCSIVPGFFDKREAREAYYNSDYTKSYELLYGKKLDNSDTIIYNKSKIILELKRKLDSYHNYMGIGQEVQALDALMSGVQKYPDIMLEAEEFHVTQEVDAIYETILNILSDKYDLSETVAKVIIDYDDLTYTRKLESIVNGTPFIRPEDENNESAVADILPEEAEIVREPVEELLPHYEGGAEDGAEVVDAEAFDETTESAAEEELPTQMQEDNAGQNTNTEQDSAGNSDAASAAAMPEETSGSTSDGQLIQGIRQPISIEINGN